MINDIKINIPIITGKQGDYIIAYCPALELSSFGQTEAEAKQSFEEALKLFITETSERGTLEKILLDLGWQLQKKPKPNYIAPPIHSVNNISNIAFLNKTVLIPA